MPATWSDLPLPSGEEGVLRPGRGGRREERGGPPLFLSHPPFAAVQGHWVSGAGSVRLAYVFLKHESPAPWYLQQSHPRWYRAGFNVNCSAADTRSWVVSVASHKPPESLSLISEAASSDGYSRGVPRPVGYNAPGWLLSGEKKRWKKQRQAQRDRETLHKKRNEQHVDIGHFQRRQDWDHFHQLSPTTFFRSEFRLSSNEQRPFPLPNPAACDCRFKTRCSSGREGEVADGALSQVEQPPPLQLA